MPNSDRTAPFGVAGLGERRCWLVKPPRGDAALRYLKLRTVFKRFHIGLVRTITSHVLRGSECQTVLSESLRPNLDFGGREQGAQKHTPETSHEARVCGRRRAQTQTGAVISRFSATCWPHSAV